MVGGERTRRALLTAIGGAGLAGVAKYVSDPSDGSVVGSASSDGEPMPTETPSVSTGAPTETPGEPPGDTPTKVRQCRPGFEYGFEQLLGGHFELFGNSVVRTTEYARSGTHSAVLQATRDNYISRPRSVPTFCGEMAVEAAVRPLTGGSETSVSVGLFVPETNAKIGVGPFAVGDDLTLREWGAPLGGSVAGSVSLGREFGAGWSTVRLDVAPEEVTARVGDATASYDPALDYATREVGVQLRVWTVDDEGSTVAAAFDNLSVGTG